MRIPFNILDEAFVHIDDPVQPLTVQIEARVAGRLDGDRLRTALQAAAATHPLARARLMPWNGRDPHPEWHIDDQLSLDPLRILDAADNDEIDAIRGELLSVPISLWESPPWRARLIHAPGGDVVLLSVHHSASDGMGCLRLLQSVLRHYASVSDPTPDLDPLAAHALDAGGPSTARQRTDSSALERRKLRQLASPPSRVASDGATQARGLRHRDPPRRRGPGRDVAAAPPARGQRQRPAPRGPPPHHRTLEHRPRPQDRAHRDPHAHQRPARRMAERGGRQPRHR